MKLVAGIFAKNFSQEHRILGDFIKKSKLSMLFVLEGKILGV
jgi:hypothetical protein